MSDSDDVILLPMNDVFIRARTARESPALDRVNTLSRMSATQAVVPAYNGSIDGSEAKS